MQSIYPKLQKYAYEALLIDHYGRVYIYSNIFSVFNVIELFCNMYFIFNINVSFNFNVTYLIHLERYEKQLSGNHLYSVNRLYSNYSK